MLRDVLAFAAKRNFRYGKNKWYVIRDVGQATRTRYREVGAVVDDLIERGMLRVRKWKGRNYLFPTKKGRDYLFEKYGDWKEKALVKLEKGEWVILVVGYREGEYWSVSDKIHGVLDWNEDVKENWSRNVYLDEYGWWLVVPRAVGERAVEELKKAGVEVFLEEGENAVGSWIAWTMVVRYMAEDIGGENDYVNKKLAD